jgi:carbon storage regulator
MLVLTRMQNEKIVITTPDGIRITVMVIAIRGDKVRLGIEAPKDVAVHREEVQNQIDGAAE